MMKRKLLLPLLLGCAIMVSAETVQVLQVLPLTGAEQQFAVEKIGKITFSSNVMSLYDTTGALLGSTNVSEIGKITFGAAEISDKPTGLQDTQSSIRIYPNPTQDALIVSGLQANETVRVYSLTGGLMQSATAAGAETSVSVSSLPNGTYLLQVGAEIVKFIKK